MLNTLLYSIERGSGGVGCGEMGKWGSGEVGRINKNNLLSPDY
ncbi:MAG: hypothetical protein O9324_05405 [Microcystis sp. LE19-84.1B]|nr:hypothetical protein [Microcystis sp. LE19-84.1B]MCZ8223396.1 hypothetical protein [Microcystis sp. LE19-84.1B]